MSVMVLVREITADDWELMRDVRLSALAEAPQAFGSTYAREVAFGEPQWRGRISDRSVTFFAHDDDPAGSAPVGLVGVYVEDGVADLVSMWVSPSARGRRVGEALVEAAARWAVARDFSELFLWVTEPNTSARRLYERCGFTATGEHAPLPSDPALTEIRMSRAL
jgi:ribosomal protein S18 acetylase RimI-like enzyme